MDKQTEQASRGKDVVDDANLIEVHTWLQNIPLGKPLKTTPVEPKQKESQGKKRRVRIVVGDDDDAADLYHIDNDAVVGVHYSSKTWMNISMNFRVAIQNRTLFSCDGFLGASTSNDLYKQLVELKKSSYFDKSMKSSDHEIEFSCVEMKAPSQQHSHVDGLIVVVYRLLRYYAKFWTLPKVNLLHFPSGSGPRVYSEPDALHCLYFCSPDLELKRGEGTVYLQETSTPDSEYCYDRLCAFWGNKDAVFTGVSKEMFMIEMKVKESHC